MSCGLLQYYVDVPMQTSSIVCACDQSDFVQCWHPCNFHVDTAALGHACKAVSQSHFYITQELASYRLLFESHTHNIMHGAITIATYTVYIVIFKQLYENFKTEHFLKIRNWHM